jgi:predicted component of viral defense system (DUF524 family)
VLHTTEFWVLTERARRPHPVRLAQAAARGQSLSPDGHPTQVLDTRVDHSVDVYENRLVKAYVEQVHRRLRHVSRLLQQPQYAIHRPEIQHLTTRLQLACRQARFLEEVGELTQLSGHTTMVLLNRPKYRAALEGFLEFRRRATVRLEEPALVAPLENVPRLYQVWGTLKVITVLLQVAAEAGYRVHEPRLAGHDDSGVYIQVLPDGQLVLDLFHPVHGTQVKLIPERSYRTSGTLQSVSYVQRPDIAVEIERPGSSSEVYLFDPKYKLDSETLDADEPSGTPKKIDIDKMHAYRDAIRDATGHRVVTYAAIMYPGINVTYTDGLEALSAYPGATIALEQRLRHLLNTALAEPSA